MSDDTKAKKTRKTAAQAEAKAPGRPSTFTQEIADEICRRLAQGEPLEKICRDDHMPSSRTVLRWKDASEAFMSDIACAREAGFDRIASDCLDIADETSNDTLSTEHGDRPNTEWISRSKLRIETRLKLLAKWDPKRYGDKITQEHTNPDGSGLFTGIKVEFVKPNGNS